MAFCSCRMLRAMIRPQDANRYHLFVFRELDDAPLLGVGDKPRHTEAEQTDASGFMERPLSNGDERPLPKEGLPCDTSQWGIVSAVVGSGEWGKGREGNRWLTSPPAEVQHRSCHCLPTLLLPSPPPSRSSHQGHRLPLPQFTPSSALHLVSSVLGPQGISPFTHGPIVWARRPGG